MRRLWLLLLALLCTSPLYAEEKPPVAIYLTWQRDPSTTMTIQWITGSEESNDEISYIAKSGEFIQFSIGSHHPFPQGEPLFIHRAELTDLEPDTEYLFLVPGQRQTLSFRTLPKDFTRPIRFVVGGDVYHDAASYVVEMNRMAVSRDPDFAILGGDLAYAGSKFSNCAQDCRRWITFLRIFSDTLRTAEGRMIPWIPVIGNHDVSGKLQQPPQQAAIYYALFAMPGQQGYNVLDWEDHLSLILLDSGHTHAVEGEQTQWLRETLAQRQHFKHRFAVYHVPAFPSVRNFYNTRSVPVRRYWVPLFEEYALNAAFEHHDHAYKRTFPLLRGKREEGGVVYFGDGAWGVKAARKPYSPSRLPYLAYSEASRHLIFVTLDEQGRRFEAVNPKNELFDSYEQEVTLPLPSVEWDHSLRQNFDS